jgi:hypothetical protein
MAQQLHKLCPSLAAEVAKCCEQAYRRGYQQGALYGHGLDEQIADWRFNLDPSIPYQTDLTAHYATASAPPDTRGGMRAFPATSLERLEMEASNASPLIRWLAHHATQNR